MTPGSDKELVHAPLGSVGEFDIGLKDGKVELKLQAGVEGVAAGLVVTVSPRVFLDKLAAAIPGKLDDTIIAVLESALGL